jgi:hypothetical protein
MFDDSKIIVTVRDLRDVVESFEKLEEKIKSLHSFGDSPTLTAAMTYNEKYNYYFNLKHRFAVY